MPTAELLIEVVLTNGAKWKFVSVPLADIVKVSEQRNTSVPHRSTLRIRFVNEALSFIEPLLNEPLTLKLAPMSPEAAPVVTT